MSLPLPDYLRKLPNRCLLGFDLTKQHPGLCRCNEAPGKVSPEEWRLFVSAITQAADETGRVSQTDVRPRIQPIFHKHRATCYRHARHVGLLVQLDKEPSTDTAGRNGDKDQRVYLLGTAE